MKTSKIGKCQTHASGEFRMGVKLRRKPNNARQLSLGKRVPAKLNDWLKVNETIKHGEKGSIEMFGETLRRREQ